MCADVVVPALRPVLQKTETDHSSSKLGLELLCLETGDYLFEEGALRTQVYRVEQGAIAVYEKRIGRPNYTIEVAGRGSFVGFGCFERYSNSAFAIESSLLSTLTEEEFAALAERDPALRKKQVDAIHREFERRKAAILDRYPSTLVGALAAFLVSVSRQNVHEGRSATVITDTIKCGAVAGLLGTDVDSLGKALLSLKTKTLIREGTEGEIHLLNIPGLEQLADGSD